MTDFAEISPEEVEMLSKSHWVPHSAAELHGAASETFQRALESDVPPDIAGLLNELKHKMEGAEYNLRNVNEGGPGEWWEAEAFLGQARGTLEILARILHAVLQEAPDSFDRDGRPIANVLRNQPTRSHHYASSIALAEFIEGTEFIRTLSAVRDKVHHRYGLPSLAKADTGTVHLGGLTLNEFCIGFWLSLMKFTRHFLEWTITIAWETQNSD